MRFEWDEKKRRVNLGKHDLDFSDAESIFENPLLIKRDERMEYGEERYLGIGKLGEIHVMVVFTIRFDSVRIISMRKANRRERDAYEQKFRLGYGTP